ncbi:TetR/AcrR family transcriptional regulator [Bifidobacterium simiarum]|uniref:TetR family transcriptional regulator n=1 Tax=Bifidobacterium simiarum TaxID=2045441 RepID=A0A2M9HEG1_9BIFI|nr:TetR/AcrR family transcriptional regulator [Bifidobacterium simiarum]PJM75210.1 TetR family transcriptional regulator [Bifidobacterium simiarum]
MAQRRNTRTEAAIRTAFITLLKQKGLNAMTVSDIARLANINRGTFYTHYMDKFDLCQQLIDNAHADLTDIIRTSSARYGASPTNSRIELIQYETILQCLVYIKQDYAFFDAISRSGNDMVLYSKCKELIAELLTVEFEQQAGGPANTATVVSVYGREMIASATTSVLWLWMRRGCVEPPETIARFIDTARHLPPVDVMNARLVERSAMARQSGANGPQGR